MTSRRIPGASKTSDTVGWHRMFPCNDTRNSYRNGASAGFEERILLFREGFRGANRVLSATSRRSRAEAGEAWRDLFGVLGSQTPPSIQRIAAEVTDEVRSQSFLATWGTLAAGERIGGSFRGTLSPRTLALGTTASDLYSGYAALSWRERLQPGLVVKDDYQEQHRRGATRLLDSANALGGCLIKAAQFASSRPDILPKPYIDSLSTLQDSVEPHSFGIIRRAVERETGRPLAETFASFEREPVAAASIAQVHRARLTDGRQVAVKVRYPEIASLIFEDLDSLERIFDVISRLQPDIQLRSISDYLRWSLPIELDLLRESHAMQELSTALSDREDIIIPSPVEELCTEGLLVMDYIEGIRVDDVDGISAAGMNPSDVANLVNDAFADQLFRRRILHADPHPGNLRVQPGPKLVLYDHGLTLRLDDDFVESLGKMVHALRDGDFDALAKTLGETGLPVDENTDLDVLLGLLGAVMGSGDDPDDIGITTGRVGAGLKDIPPKLLLVGRAIALLDGLTSRLDDDIEALDIVARYAER